MRPEATAGRQADPPSGVALVGGSYVLWGLFPIYFKAVASVAAPEVLAHRIVWSLLLLALITTVCRGWAPVRAALATPRLLATLAISATTLAVNWGVFIWAVAAGRVLDCSLGYFMSPLVSVVLGVFVLGERLRGAQWLAVALASAGVAGGTVAFGTIPWIGLTLAVSFGAYGLLRKVAPVDPVGGLFIEALLLAPPALGLLAYLAADGQGTFASADWRLDELLLLAGPVTTLPLILFVAGTRRIRLATVGLLQYITPTGHFLLAVALYGELLSWARLASFACVWAALVLYTADLLRRGRRTPG